MLWSRSGKGGQVCDREEAEYITQIDLRPRQRDNGYVDGRSQNKVYTAKRTQVHSAQSSLAVTHPISNRARRYLTSVTESPSKHWLPPRTSHY